MLDPARPDRDRRLAGEHRRQLDVAQAERVLVALVEHLEHAQAALVVEERHRGDRLGHVARLLGGAAAEPCVPFGVGDGDRLAARVDIAGEALVGRDREPDDALALLACGDPEDELVRGCVVQRDGGRVGIEQGDRRLDDRSQDGVTAARLQAARGLDAKPDRLERRHGIGPEWPAGGRIAHRAAPLTARMRGRGGRDPG